MVETKHGDGFLTQKIWTDDEVKQLSEMVGKITTAAIAVKLGRSQDSVYHKVKTLGYLERQRVIPPTWTPEQFEKLKTHPVDMTMKEFAEANGVTFESVRYWTYKLGYRFKNNGDVWSEGQIACLRSCHSAKQVMRQTGRDYRSVMRKAKSLGIVLDESRTTQRAKETHKRILGEVHKNVAKVPSASVQMNKSRVGTVPKQERSLIQQCPKCFSPVSNWEQHFSRMPQCSPTQKITWSFRRSA